MSHPRKRTLLETWRRGMDSDLKKKEKEKGNKTTKQLASLGMAININSLPGQIWRWFGEILNLDMGSSGFASCRGWIWNSHHRVSI